jgi:hypothetical protein
LPSSATGGAGFGWVDVKVKVGLAVHKIPLGGVGIGHTAALAAAELDGRTGRTLIRGGLLGRAVGALRLLAVAGAGVGGLGLGDDVTLGIDTVAAVIVHGITLVAGRIDDEIAADVGCFKTLAAGVANDALVVLAGVVGGCAGVTPWSLCCVRLQWLALRPRPQARSSYDASAASHGVLAMMHILGWLSEPLGVGEVRNT